MQTSLMRGLSPIRFLVIFLCWHLTIEGTKAHAAQLPPESQGLSSVEDTQAEKRQQSLNSLFTQLKSAKSAAEGERLAQNIWGLWFQSGSATIDLLMSQARKAMQVKRYDLALDLLNMVVLRDQNYAEGWNARATLHYLRGDFIRSISDIEQTLALEPRHFGALSGLGMILTQQEKFAKALAVFEQALTIHPFLKIGRQQLKALRQRISRDI